MTPLRRALVVAALALAVVALPVPAFAAGAPVGPQGDGNPGGNAWDRHANGPAVRPAGGGGARGWRIA